MISEAYLPAAEEESMDILRYLTPWLSRTEAASLIVVLFPSKVSVLIPITSPPIDLIVSFNSLSLDNSATQGLQPVNQKFTTVTALPESYRQAFVMHRFRDMSYEEIAETLEVSPKTVDYRIQQALKQLRIDLKDYLPLLLPLLFP